MRDDERLVLVVEDDEAVREAIRETLEDQGYATRGAANGEEALRLLDQTPRPRLILLDLMMPVMNGWETLHTLQSSAALARIPVVVISALSGLRAPAGVPLLAKPIQVHTLLRVVEEYAST
jgi:two-component system, chemotaxis family, chemotaxis protein CheY